MAQDVAERTGPGHTTPEGSIASLALSFGAAPGGVLGPTRKDRVLDGLFRLLEQLGGRRRSAGSLRPVSLFNRCARNPLGRIHTHGSTATSISSF